MKFIYVANGVKKAKWGKFIFAIERNTKLKWDNFLKKMLIPDSIVIRKSGSKIDRLEICDDLENLKEGNSVFFPKNKLLGREILIFFMMKIKLNRISYFKNQTQMLKG